MCVLSFTGSPAQTLLALQEMFGIDPEHARQVMDSVPVVIRHECPAEQAQGYVEALQKLGAQVVLEASAGATPSGASAGPRPGSQTLAGGYAAEAQRAAGPSTSFAGLTAPRQSVPGTSPSQAKPRAPKRGATGDLELDLLRNDGKSLAQRRAMHDPASDPEGQGQKRKARQQEQRNLDLSDGNVGLDLADIEPTRPLVHASATSMARTPDGRRGSGPEPMASGPEIISGKDAVGTDAAASATRVAGMARTAAETARAAKRAKSGRRGARESPLICLGRICFAVMIIGGGLRVETSILYGDASLLCVVIHACGIYQLGVGLRGLLP